MIRTDRVAWVAAEAPGRESTNYPPPFSIRVKGRRKQPLGELFRLTNFGVNLTTLQPGSQSSVRHRHRVQDEFVYVLTGELVLIHDDGETSLAAGMCAGFRHGGTAHHLVNRSDAPASYLEIGDRRVGDSADYPDDDLIAERVEAGWRFTHRNGDPY